MDTNLIGAVAEDCLNHSSVEISNLEFLGKDCSLEDFQQIADQDGVSARITLYLSCECLIIDRYFSMIIEALIRIDDDGNISFEGGDSFIDDLPDRFNLNVKIYEDCYRGDLDELIFSSQDDDCSGLEVRIAWDDLEEHLIASSKKKLEALKADCKKIIEVAKILSYKKY